MRLRALCVQSCVCTCALQAGPLAAGSRLARLGQGLARWGSTLLDCLTAGWQEAGRNSSLWMEPEMVAVWAPYLEAPMVSGYRQCAAYRTVPEEVALMNL